MGYTHGIKWTEKLIESKVKQVVKELGLATFPTHTEIKECLGDKKLASKISKTGGTRYWANKLKMEIKTCESEFGNYYELLAIDTIYEKTGLKARQMKPGYPYDILVNECIKIDIKASHPFKNNCNAYANTFNLEKKEPTCDLFTMFCLTRKEDIGKILIIPSCILTGKTQIGVGAESKWDKYEGKWELFDAYYEFYKAFN